MYSHVTTLTFVPTCDYIDHNIQSTQVYAITLNLHDKLFHIKFASSFQQWLINCYDWPLLVIALLVLSFVLFYILGLELRIFRWNFEKIYYQLSNKRGGANKREVVWIFGTLMKAENSKIENFEKVLDEGKDENIDIQVAGLYQGYAWSKITVRRMDSVWNFGTIMRITFCLEGLYIIVHHQIYRPFAESAQY